MKVLKILAKICYVLALGAAIASAFIPVTTGDPYSGYYQTVYLTLEPIIIIALSIGVVAAFVEEPPVFRKVGLALLIGAGVGLMGLSSIVKLAAGGVIFLGLALDFIAYLMYRGESGGSSEFDSKVERIEKLHELLEKKIISEEEYQDMRTKILGIQKKRK